MKHVRQGPAVIAPETDCMIAAPMQESLPIRKRTRKIIAGRNYPLITRSKYLVYYYIYIIYILFRTTMHLGHALLHKPILFGLPHLIPRSCLLSLGHQRLARATAIFCKRPR